MPALLTGNKIKLGVLDKSLDVSGMTSAQGNEWFGLTGTRKDGQAHFEPYGRAVPALSTELPTEVALTQDDEIVTVYLASSTTEDGRRKVSYSGAITLPDGRIMHARVSISETRTKDWNVTVKVFPGRETSARKLASWN